MRSLQEILLYFDPVEPLNIKGDERILNTLKDQVTIHGMNSQVPNITDARVLLFGIGKETRANLIREWLYGLSGISSLGLIADLGNLRNGKSPADTRIGLADVITEAGKAQKILLVLGASSHEILTFGLAYNRLETPYNLTVVDPVIDVMPEEYADRSHYVNALISNPDGNLFDFVHLGYQSYLTDPGSFDRMDELFFEHQRLGNLREDLREAEPVFRNSDLVSFSLASIRQTEAPGVFYPSANGLTAEEACQLTRFAGLSDKLSLLAISDFDDARDLNGQTAGLAAQMTWFFLQGISQRKSDYPFSDIHQYQKYIVDLPKSGYHLTFYKSPNTNRWWVEVPYPASTSPRSLFVACSYRDYQIASEGEIPDRWWNNYRRLSL
jgi:arginase family enzyme